MDPETQAIVNRKAEELVAEIDAALADIRAVGRRVAVLFERLDELEAL